MGSFFADLKKVFWDRNKSGENFYGLVNEQNWGITGCNLEIAQNHPILTPAMLFVSKLFSQADFKLVSTTTGKEVKSHPLLDLLGNPNYYQTKMDMLESLMFMMIANGVGVIYKKSIIGFNEPEAIYLLDYYKIKWPEGFKTEKSAMNSDNKIGETVVTYDEDGENLKIKLKDLMFFYDLPSALNSKDIYKNKSRLDGLHQTLVNTCDSLVAKNIILRSNGKEMITGGRDGFPLGDEEKKEAQALFNANYGLAAGKSRSLITRAAIDWKSLHIALRDLGLDESVKVDGNIIYTALHIPKDILSLEAKKTTYNNFKESMVSYIQNEITSSLDAFCEVINKSLKYKNLKLVGSYDHLPVMQFVLLEKYDIVGKQAAALKALLDIGVPLELALEMCGMPKDTKIIPPKVETSTAANPTSSTST